MKKWASARMRENYEDFERLLTAKNSEVKALIDAKDSDNVANAHSAGLNADELQKALDWIEYNEPKIN